MPRLPKGASASRMMPPNPRMMADMSGPQADVSPTGAPPIPRYNARALRPGGMANGGSVKGMTRGDGMTTRGHTRGKMV